MLRYTGLETFGIGTKVFFLEKDVMVSVNKKVAEKFGIIVIYHKS